MSGSDATFTHPITLNLYQVGPMDTVGDPITSVTDEFDLPYRPSADDEDCTGGDAGKWFDGTSCNNGFLSEIEFDLSGTDLTLPDRLIVTVAFNTSSYGEMPIGTDEPCYTGAANCFYDALNVGAHTVPPTAGSHPLPNGTYWNTSTASNYCDGGTGGAGTLRLDDDEEECWLGLQPSIRVSVPDPVPPTPVGPCANVITGTSGDDRLIGTATGDKINGLGGADKLNGLGGVDCLTGGAGDDAAYGGQGKDLLRGYNDDDRLFGGPGRDALTGNRGADRLFGGSGPDKLVGNQGHDRLVGGAGQDRLEARDNTVDHVICGAGRDVAIVDRRDIVSGNCEKVRVG